MLICESLEHWSSVRPRQPALIERGRTIDWTLLLDKVRANAAGLLSAGLRPGDRVGLALRDGSDYVAAALALQWAGIVVVPMDWRTKAPERRKLIDDFRLTRVLVSSTANCGYKELNWPPSALDDRALEAHPGGERDPYAILLSSGTTGTPSGALVSRISYEARMHTIRGDVDEFVGVRYFSCRPLHFSSGFAEVLRNLVHGNSVVLQDPLFTAEELLKSIVETEASYVCLVPTVLRWMLNLSQGSPLPLPKVRCIVLGGAPVSMAEKLEASRILCPNIVESYGAAAVGVIAYSGVQEARAHPGSVGKPLPVIEVRTSDANGRTTAVGEPGLFQCRSPTLASALLTADGETSLIGQWYSPGDIARLDGDGYLYLEGRATDVIIRGGVNVYPEMVENAIRSHPAVLDAAVVGRPAGDAGESVVAFVCLRAAAAESDLLAHCIVNLSPKYVPEEIRIVKDLPRTASGKVLRRELRDSLMMG